MKSAGERAGLLEKELQAASKAEAAHALKVQQLQGRAAELERDAAAARQLRERVQDLETQVGSAAASKHPHTSELAYCPEPDNCLKSAYC